MCQTKTDSVVPICASYVTGCRTSRNRVVTTCSQVPNPYESKSSGVEARSAPSEMLVRPFRGERELGGVGVQVALGRLDRGVSEDVTDDVKRDAGVREPCGSGVSEVVSSQTGWPSLCTRLVQSVARESAPVVRTPPRGPRSSG